MTLLSALVVLFTFVTHLSDVNIAEMITDRFYSHYIWSFLLNYGKYRFWFVQCWKHLDAEMLYIIPLSANLYMQMQMQN